MKTLEGAPKISQKAFLFGILYNFIRALVAACTAPLGFPFRRRIGCELDAVNQPS
tara:strand:+ start:220 stop:384 length:165 start_codon:yes stop_codon:yes gene_type:complete